MFIPAMTVHKAANEWVVVHSFFPTPAFAGPVFRNRSQCRFRYPVYRTARMDKPIYTSHLEVASHEVVLLEVVSVAYPKQLLL